MPKRNYRRYLAQSPPSQPVLVSRTGCGEPGTERNPAATNITKTLGPAEENFVGFRLHEVNIKIQKYKSCTGILCTIGNTFGIMLIFLT